jgi:hypothetical protein
MTHPSDESLARYAAGETPRDEGRALEAHLAGCPECQRRVDALPPSGGRTVRWQAHRFAAGRSAGGASTPGEVAEREADYRARRERGDRLLSAFGGVLGALHLRRVDELLAEPEHRRRQLLRQEGERFGGLNLCELLEERCRTAWRSDPGEAVELAKLAVLVAGEADPELYGSGKVGDARELALLHLGVSFRIAGRAEGEEGGEVSMGEEGGEVPVSEVEAALEEVRAAFLEREMWFDAAQAALDRLRLLRDLGRLDEMARSSESAADALREAGAPDRAEEPVRRVARAHARGELAPPDQDLFDELDRAVQDARNDPRMRFDPSGGDEG